MITDFKTKGFLNTTTPDFKKDEKTYTISAKKGAYYSAGMFYSSFDVTKYREKTVSAQVNYSFTGTKTIPMALILFFDENDTKIKSDYFFKGENLFSFEGDVPKTAVRCEINLLGFFFGEETIEFSDLILYIAEKKPHRIVNVATAFIECKGSPESNMEQVYSILDEAGTSKDKPDIICFTEGVHCLQAGGKREFLNDNSQEIKNVCKKAKEHSMYVLFTALEEDEKGFQYNTAFVITPEGKIQDRYRKTHLTLSELKMGLVPGSELRVFDLSFGKIAILICWDMWFPQAVKEYEKQGAEILFWLTRGFHEERLVTRARDNGLYIVSSHPKPENCRIAHPTTGESLVKGDKKSGFVSKKIDLDERQISEYKSFGLDGGNDREIFISELRNDLYTF